MNHVNSYIVKQNRYISKNKYISEQKVVGISLQIKSMNHGYNRDIQEICYSLLKLIV